MSAAHFLLPCLVAAAAATCTSLAAQNLVPIDFDRQGVGGVDGLDAPYLAIISPDGAHVYVLSDPSVSPGGEAIATFRRDSATGELTFIGARFDQLIPPFVVPGAFANAVFSPDGGSLYITDDETERVYRYQRNANSGALTYSGYVQDDVDGVTGLENPVGATVSPDGRHLYVVSHGSAAEVGALAVFDRNAATGALTYRGRYIDGVNGNDGLDGPWQVAVSPDGENVYVTAEGDESVSAWERDPATGLLTFRQKVTNGGGIDGLDTAYGVTVAPDGRHVYVGGYEEVDISIFGRGPTGLLDYVGKRNVGIQLAELLLDPRGDQLYTGAGGLYAYTRNPTTGLLTYRDRAFEGLDGVTWLSGLGTSALSPDGRHLYLPARFEDHVVSYDTGRGTSALLQGSRFRVEALFDSPAGDGEARPVVLTPDTAYFWFFQASNVELVVKVLNGCGTNDRFWVFVSGLTNVDVELTVTDTETGQQRTYLSPQGTTFAPRLDTQAFATCP